jgi:hypothetical protein
MPLRNQSTIRRDINRLDNTVQHRKSEHPALEAISDITSEIVEKINTIWQAYQAISVQGDKERKERDLAIRKLIKWVQRWRSVIMMRIPGASDNIHKLPSKGATPDDVIRVADDIIKFINTNQSAEPFRTSAIDELGDMLENARKETDEATHILPEETATRNAYTDVCLEANSILIPGTEIIRAIFGRTSPEYKQFIARASKSEEDEIDKESNTGEE